MLQCAAAVVQSQEQPHLNRNPQKGAMKREAETAPIAISSKVFLSEGCMRRQLHQNRKGDPSYHGPP
jgi:hypothetical protein